jgi:hypothetical protein
VSGAFSATDAVAGAATAGARSTFVTVTCVFEAPESALLAVNVTEYAPDWLYVGVQLSVPDLWSALEVNMAPEGMFVAVSDVID